MKHTLSIAILDDHSITIDGYRQRLAQDPDLTIAWTAAYGEELPPLMDAQPVDVLILDISVPTSANNPSLYPILDVLPQLLERHDALTVLVISMHAESRLIKAVMNAGAAGYILKEDRASLDRLDQVVRAVAAGEIHMSPLAAQRWQERLPDGDRELTPRQLQVLALCHAYPNEGSTELATRMSVSPVTLRNLLSGVYLRLKVRSRTAAVAEAQRRGLIAPAPPAPRM